MNTDAIEAIDWELAAKRYVEQAMKITCEMSRIKDMDGARDILKIDYIPQGESKVQRLNTTVSKLIRHAMG